MKKKILALCLGLLLAFTPALTGCAGKDDPNTLYISIFQGGYGTEFIDALADIFTEENPEIKVKKIVVAQPGDAATEFLSGVSKVDLYFTRALPNTYVSEAKVLNGTRYDYAVEDLTELFNQTIPGESQTMMEKMNDQFVDFVSYTRENDTKKYFSVPWAVGSLNIIKNNKVWKSGWKVPNTTDELIALCEQIKLDGTTPFIYCLKDSYWHLLSPVWAAQYEGMERTMAFWDGYSPDGDRYVPEMFLYQGFLESLKVMETLLADQNKYMHSYSKSMDFTSTQNYFVDPQYNIAMTVNGDWMDGEIRRNYDPSEIDVEAIKTPIVSALGTKLGITDAQLSAAVDAIDNGTAMPTFTSTEGYGQAEIEAAIREARGINISSSGSHVAWIPAYSNAKDAAKKFLQLMASDRGIEAYVKATGGFVLPYDYDYFGNTELTAVLDDFLKSANRSIIDSMDPTTGEQLYFVNYNRNRLFNLSGLKQFMNGMSSYESYFSATIIQDYKSAETVFRENYEYVEGRWSTYLMNAGLK